MNEEIIEYTKPNMQIFNLNAEDVVTLSKDTTGGPMSSEEFDDIFNTGL